jgi:hypothetical protein
LDASLILLLASLHYGFLNYLVLRLSDWRHVSTHWTRAPYSRHNRRGSVIGWSSWQSSFLSYLFYIFVCSSEEKAPTTGSCHGPALWRKKSKGTVFNYYVRNTHSRCACMKNGDARLRCHISYYRVIRDARSDMSRNYDTFEMLSI